jgi:hypothetical protein
MKQIIIGMILAASAAAAIAPPAGASSPDEQFLDKLEYDSIMYFAGESNPANGLVKDSSRPGAPCSVAAVGFALAAMCVGESRGWIDRSDAYDRVFKILKTFRDNVPTERGFYYHFLDMRTGARAWNSELSSIDTALFLAGALFAGEYFKGTEAEKIAGELYERVEWPWMLNGKKMLCMGWKPESGFLWYYWDTYSEAAILYALAIGSPTHPIPQDSWLAWSRPVGSYKDFKLVHSYTGSIFTYQYSHAWIDFRGLYDGDIDYFINSREASRANRAFCVDNAAKHKAYGEESWGLTACIGPEGYKGYGAEPGEALHDGTIAPCGMAGSIVFDWQACLGGLKYLYEKHGSFLYGKYGFKDAFNLDRNWWAEEYLGIDVGITLLMIENYRTSLIWSKFMNLDFVKRWAGLCMRTQTDPRD